MQVARSQSSTTMEHEVEQNGGMVDFFGLLLFSMCAHQILKVLPSLSHMFCPMLSSWNLHRWANIETIRFGFLRFG
jgi:hypothetical protein